MIGSIDTHLERDSDLLRRITCNDEHALEQLYDCYSPLLFNVISRVVGIREEAENILQEVFLQIWNRANSYNPLLGSPVVWLIQIARNKSIDYWRSKPARMRKKESDLGSAQEIKDTQSNTDPHEIISSLQTVKAVREAMNRLPQTQKQLIELAYYEGYSQSELAEKFSIPLGTVKSRMRAGMIALREQLITTPELLY